jgi:DNA-binding MarR family transcriptional regulator
MPSSDVRDRLDDPLIGPLLRVPWQAIRKRIVDGLAEKGFGDVGAAHLGVLQHPTPDGVRPGELAARSQMSKQAANRLIRHLEGRGYIELEPDLADQRARIIRLTERGWDLIAAIQSIVADVEAEWARRLGERRFRTLRRTLADLGEIVRSGDNDGR